MPEAVQRSSSFDTPDKKASSKKERPISIPGDYSDSINF